MPTDVDLLLKAAAPGLANDHISVRRSRLLLGQIKIALRPGRNDFGHIARVARTAEQMIGARKGHEAFRMLGRLEDAAGILDADPIVGRRMENQQRPAHLRDLLTQILLGNIIQKGTADTKPSSLERDLDLALLRDILKSIPEQAGDMGHPTLITDVLVQTIKPYR